MQITIKNLIQIDEHTEIIEEVHEVEYQVKGAFGYLLYQNEAEERVVIKFNDQELVMSRFSNPKSILRFNQGQKVLVQIPTPMGNQPFLTATDDLKVSDGRLELNYQLLQIPAPDSERPPQVFATYQLLISWG